MSRAVALPGRPLVRALFVAVLAIVTLAIAATAQAQQVRVKVRRANVRAEASRDSVVLMTLDGGTLLDVVAKKGDWYLVKLPPNNSGLTRTGYVAASIVEVLQPSPTSTVTPSAQTVEPAPSRSSPKEIPTPTAASTPGETESAIEPTAGSPAILSGPLPSQGSSAERQAWAFHLAEAHDRVSNAKRILWAGAGMAAASLLIYKVGFYDSKGLAAIGMFAGAGVAGVGFMKMTAAQRQVGALNDEGRAKGFVVFVVPHHAELAYAFRF